MKKVYNFFAGPAMIPVEVMQQAHQEFLNWNNMGLSIMEISHRSNEFIDLTKKIEKELRELLNVPSDYHVLFLHGGARGQFSAIPMNLLDQYQKVAYIRTGAWSALAVDEAKSFAPVEIIADSELHHYLTIPPESEWKDFQDAAYLYYCDNETVHGIEFPYVPSKGKVPLVADMSSNLFSRSIDIEKFDLIYACAQKNFGMAGITLVIVSDKLLNRKPMHTTPHIFRYDMQTKQESMCNTPPTYPWYMTGLILNWIKKQGGVVKMEEKNRVKAKKLYDYIDGHSFYKNSVDPKYRSRMNVVFQLTNSELENKFVSEAEKNGLLGLKGHRSVGGIRASIYNAMTEEGVDTLINFMQNFERQYG